MSRNQRYDWDALEPRIVEMHAAGVSNADIARALGVHKITLQSWMTRTGLISPQRRAWNSAERQRLVELMESGKSVHACCRVLHRSYDSVMAQARDLGLIGAAVTASEVPTAHKVIGRAGDDPEVMAQRVARYVYDIGAAALMSRRGIIAAAIPGSRVSQAAEREGCIVATYCTEPRDPRYRMTLSQLRAAIAEDLQHEISRLAA